MSGIYIHIPFCKQKCIYCNFFSVANTTRKTEYLQALQKEIALTQDFLPDKEISTLYFGGGTPSLCTASELDMIIQTLIKYHHFNNSLELTLEANPEQLNKEYLHSLKEIGINRLSIGVQSFQDPILKLLKRQHTAEEARQAVLHAAECGFDNISIDLIYDIAYREEAQWREDLQTALSLPISHLSAYSLTVEENTLLAKNIREGTPFLPSEELTERDFNILQSMTSSAHFNQYEISNFAKNGRISRHNFSYWNDTPYLGLGASAHSYNGTLRKWNQANLIHYIKDIQEGRTQYNFEVLNENQKYNEFVLLHLRISEGIKIEEVRNRFGEEKLNYLLKRLANVKLEHYTQRNGSIILTNAGKLFADAVALELFYAE